jgi:adenylate cyclase
LFFSQSSIDSLYTVWKDKTQKKSDRGFAYLNYIYELKPEVYPDSILKLSRELYNFSLKNKDTIGTIDVLSLIGYTYFETGNYPKAVDSYNEAITFAKTINDSSGLANLYLKLGIIHHDNGDLIKGIDFYQKSEELYIEIEDEIGLGSIYNEFGSLYLAEGDFDKSLEYYQKSLQMCQDKNDMDDCSAQLSNLGSLFFGKKEYSKAREYYHRSLEISKKLKSRYGIADSYSGIGQTFFEEGENDKALEFLNKSLDIYKSMDNVLGVAINLLNLGYIYIDKKQFRKAIKYCGESLEITKSIGDFDSQLEPSECLYEAYKAIGNPSKALYYLENRQVIFDSLKLAKTSKKLQKIEFQKKQATDSLLQVKKDLKIKLDHQIQITKKDKNRNIVISIGILFLILASGFFARWKLVKKSKRIIEKEKERSDNLLLNILPAEIAEELKIKGKADAKDFDLVSILFTDFKGFTEASENLTAQELIEEINICFKAFDYICEKYNIEKIKTIGDAYMAAGGLPIPSNASVKNTVLAALEMQAFIKNRILEKIDNDEIPFEMRLGVHTGPVVAGIVGVKKFQYDIWGDTVNTASRMESSGEIGKVNISETTYELLKNDPEFEFDYRGKIEAKGKGKIKMYFISKPV